MAGFPLNQADRMKKIIIHCALPIVAALTLAGCWGSRYVSADSDLESVYKGRSYYEVVGEFGRQFGIGI